ncbi:hypothetical protein MKX01_034301 [Papaver californicum]|nr:hypothetical protein MKX01_034301 [Papaver californicum]
MYTPTGRIWSFSTATKRRILFLSTFLVLMAIRLGYFFWCTEQKDSYTTISERTSLEKEIKKSKFIAIAGPIGDQYRSNDDGEPSGTSGKPIYSAIDSSGIDSVMVVVIRYFGGIKLGTGGLVRAYGGVTSECLKNAPTCLIKSKIQIDMEVPYYLLGLVYHQLQDFQVENIKQDYDTGNDGITVVSFMVDYDKAESLECAVKDNCSRNIVFSKH